MECTWNIPVRVCGVKRGENKHRRQQIHTGSERFAFWCASGTCESTTRPPPTAANAINSDDGATTNFQHGAAKAFNPFATRKSRGMQPCATLASSRLPTFGAGGKWEEAQIAKANKLPLVLGRAQAKIKPQHAASQRLQKIFRTSFCIEIFAPAGWLENLYFY